MTITPSQILCDYWLFATSITASAAGDPSIPSAVFLGKYARTWMETSPAGPLQVWRWLVNCDVNYSYSAATPPPSCKIPFAALPPYGLPIHFFGHIDYALNCSTGGWDVAMVLTHLCPHEAHAPFGQYPLAVPAGTPSETYHFVAPANFVFAACFPPAGAIVADAQRTSALFPVYACETENQIVKGDLLNVFHDCACSTGGGPFTPPAYAHQSLSATVFSSCAAAPQVSSLPIPGILPTGLRFLGIGFWLEGTANPTYPGPACVGHYLGVLSWNDVCPTPTPSIGFDIVTGVGHSNGWPMVPFVEIPAVAVFHAVDLHNMLEFSNFLPTIGGLFGSTRVWSFNMLDSN